MNITGVTGRILLPKTTLSMRVFGPRIPPTLFGPRQTHIYTYIHTYISCEISIEHPSVGLASLAQLHNAMKDSTSCRV